MKTLGLGLNSLIILLVIAYLLYLVFADNTLPEFINDLFSNLLFRISVLSLIVFATIGDKKNGLGGPIIGIMLAIAYIVTENLIYGDAETFYLENFEDIEEDEIEGFDSDDTDDDDGAQDSNQYMMNMAQKYWDADVAESNKGADEEQRLVDTVNTMPVKKNVN